MNVQSRKPSCLQLRSSAQSTNPSNVPSKLNPKYSGLCDILAIRGPVLTLRELDFRKVFTANHVAVRSSSFSQPEGQFPEVPADLRLFDMSLSSPEAGRRDFPDAEVRYDKEIKDTNDPVIQSMNLSLPEAGFNPLVLSFLDLQCSPPHAVLSQSRSLRVRRTRHPRAFRPLYTSTQTKFPSLLSIPASVRRSLMLQMWSFLSYDVSRENKCSSRVYGKTAETGHDCHCSDPEPED